MGLISRVSSRTYRFTTHPFHPRHTTPETKTTMSSSISCLELSNDDARKIMAAKMHIGSNNCNFQMLPYVFKRNTAGTHIINIGKCGKEIILTARIIAAVENPEDVCVVSTKEMGHRAIIKFAKFIGASSTSGRFSPGTFTNHSQAGFKEPRLVIVTDPTVDHQAVREASYVNIPIIGLCDMDSQLKYIDVVIPCNNRNAQSSGLVWWLLAREVQRLRGTLSRSEEWEIMPDLFFYRNLEEIKKQEEEERAKAEHEADAAAEQRMENQQDVYQDDGNWNEAENYGAPAAEDWNKPAAANAQDWAATEENPANQDWATAGAGEAPEATGW